VRRRQQPQLEPLPGDLAAERGVQAALDLGARRRRIDETRRDDGDRDKRDDERRQRVAEPAAELNA
jgi:hypothetical protein